MPEVPRDAGRQAPFRGQLLPSDERAEAPLAGLFPELREEDDLWEAIFGLLYQQHGGSGLHLGLSDIMELDLRRIQWLLERLETQREREARALEAAGRNRR